jgi:hypothetical protein
MKPRTDVPDDEGVLLHLVADLLYEPDDPRATQWPTPAALGLIRSRVRGIADSAVDGVIGARCTATPEQRQSQ